MPLTSEDVAGNLAPRSQEGKTLRSNAGSGDNSAGTGWDDNIRLLPDAATEMKDNPALAIGNHRPAIAREGHHRGLRGSTLGEVHAFDRLLLAFAIKSTASIPASHKSAPCPPVNQSADSNSPCISRDPGR